MTKCVHVPLGDRAYDIHIGADILDKAGACLESAGVRGVVGLVSDAHVAPRYADALQRRLEAAGFRCALHVMPAGESVKRLARIEEICGVMLENGLDRSSALVALGGGVVGDVVGFAAACFMRGVPYLQIPTTIVAQVDSSVGGKTAVNHPLGKNTIGAFHQPCAVLIDMTFLRSLPGRELRAGCAEIIKHGVIADAALFAYLEEHADAILAGDLDALAWPIQRSCEIKAAVVAEDEHEQGLRAILNYGHTFGHAIETVSRYEQFLHGEAVALGMCAAGALGRALGLVDAAFVSRQQRCVRAYELPARWEALPVDETLAAMKKDKKARAGVLKFIVPTAMGSVVLRDDVAEAQARAALESLREESSMPLSSDLSRD